MASDRFGSNCKVIWHDRKHWMWFPWSFTRFDLVEPNEGVIKLYTSKGLIKTTEEQLALFRVADISVNRGFWNFFFGVGNVVIHSSDRSDSTITLNKIRKYKKVRNLLNETVERERLKHGVKLSENDYV